MNSPATTGAAALRTPASLAAALMSSPGALNMSRLYLSCLDPHATAFTFLTVDDKLREDGTKRGDRTLLNPLHGSFDSLRPTLIDLNSRGAGVFVAVNRTDLKGRRRHNITAARALWHDQDIANIEPMLPQEAPPSLVIETSPGKRQRLWFVDGLSLEDCSDCMRTMVEKYHSDPNAALLTQILRLPGFLHMKREPYPVRIIGGRSDEMVRYPYVPAELLKSFPPTPKLTPTRGAQREPGADWDVERVRSALKQVPLTLEGVGPAGDYEHWLKIGMALHHGSNGADEGLEAWHDWSEQQADKYDSDVLDDKWHGFRSDGATSITIATLFHSAKDNGWTPPPMAMPFDVVKPYEGDSAATPESEHPTIDAATKRLVLNPKDPMRSARALVAQNFTREGAQVLRRVGGDFYEWRGTHYQDVADDAMNSLMWKYLERAVKAVHAKKEGDANAFEYVPFQPTRENVGNVVDALRGLTHASIEAPSWIGANPPAWDPADVIACANGFLHLPTRTLVPSSPALFVTASLPFAYDAAAPAPGEWLKFLGSLWPDDAECVDCLQEFAGLFLTSDMRFHKMLFLLGPRRSGKGTVARVMTALLGQQNVVSPTMGSLSTDFGMESLINKRLALLSDARLSARSDSSKIAERLLTITGDDSVTIPRKYRTDWTGRLSTRVMMLSNDLPKFGDASGALPSRFIILPMQHSFLGREDLDLEARLLKELPGILNWALQGLDRLKARRRFAPPRSGADAMQALEDLASPVSTFARDECKVGPGEESLKTELYAAWRLWCERRGQPPGTDAKFGGELRSAFPSIGEKRGSLSGKRVNLYTGIALVKTHNLLQF